MPQPFGKKCFSATTSLPSFTLHWINIAVCQWGCSRVYLLKWGQGGYVCISLTVIGLATAIWNCPLKVHKLPVAHCQNSNAELCISTGKNRVSIWGCSGLFTERMGMYPVWLFFSSFIFSWVVKLLLQLPGYFFQSRCCRFNREQQPNRNQIAFIHCQLAGQSNWWDKCQDTHIQSSLSPANIHLYSYISFWSIQSLTNTYTHSLILFHSLVC